MSKLIKWLKRTIYILRLATPKISFNKYDFLFYFGFIFWISETIFFGFNSFKDASHIEKFLDVICSILVVYGILGNFIQSINKATIINVNIEGLNHKTNVSYKIKEK